MVHISQRSYHFLLILPIENDLVLLYYIYKDKDYENVDFHGRNSDGLHRHKC